MKKIYARPSLSIAHFENIHCETMGTSALMMSLDDGTGQLTFTANSSTPQAKTHAAAFRNTLKFEE